MQSSELRLPEDVVQYVRYFKQMIEAENVPEIHSLYEHGFPELTERFFREKLWPDDAAVEHIVGSGLWLLLRVVDIYAYSIISDNKLFLILYKEIYFRHVYMKMQRGPSLAHRYDSYMNYQDLFIEILNAKEQPLSLQLPNIWLWDIIDEFVYQVCGDDQFCR